MTFLLGPEAFPNLLHFAFVGSRLLKYGTWNIELISSTYFMKREERNFTPADSEIIVRLPSLKSSATHTNKELLLQAA